MRRSRSRQAVYWCREASATLIIGPNPLFAVIVPALSVLLSTFWLSRLLKSAGSSSEKETRRGGNEMPGKECAQRLIEGVLTASGVQLAVI
jgi:hypothetical protein